MSDELTQLRGQVQQLTAELATASRDAYVLKAAHDSGVEPEQLARMAGDTPEQIAQNAERVRVGQQGGFDGGQQGTAPVDPKALHGSPDQILRRATGYDDGDT